jgi:hypothetical protein
MVKGQKMYELQKISPSKCMNEKHTKALHEKTLFPSNDKPFIHILGLPAAMELCFCKLLAQVNKL